MIAPTRRRFLGGAAAAIAAPALTGAESASAAELVPAKQRTVRRGRAIAVAARSRTIVIAHAGLPTIAVRRGGKMRLVDVGGQPVEVATSPGGRLAAVTTGFWDRPGVAVVPLRGGGKVVRIAVGDAPRGVAFTADGRHLVVSGDTEVFVIDVARRRVVAQRPLGLNGGSVAPVPRTDHAWIALNGEGAIALVDGRNGKTVRRLAVPPLPDRVAVSGDRKHLLVTHGGREVERVSEVEVASGKVRRRKVGRLPSGVGWSRGGRMVVALGGDGKIAVISPGGRVVRHRVGGAPRGIAIASGKAWTVDALTGKPAKVKL